MVLAFIAIALLGMVVGLFLERIAIFMIDKRVSKPIVNKLSGSIYKTILWATFNAICWISIALVGGINAKTVEFVLILSACIVISAVDLTIKKIPNEMLLFILAVGAVFVFFNNKTESINLNIIGFIVGAVMFFLPALIGKGAGWGDVKYAAVVGFILGIYNFLTAVILMTLILAIYTVFIIITKKGNLKTKIALGPFLSVGFIVVIALNIINTNWMLFDIGKLLNVGN